jgi:L-asparaginase/Glu-tRNA(Gln) amidotransferase subunit D
MLLKGGAVLAGGLSAWKARVILMVALAGGITERVDLRALFEV